MRRKCEATIVCPRLRKHTWNLSRNFCDAMMNDCADIILTWTDRDSFGIAGPIGPLNFHRYGRVRDRFRG